MNSWFSAYKLHIIFEEIEKKIKQLKTEMDQSHRRTLSVVEYLNAMNGLHDEKLLNGKPPENSLLKNILKMADNESGDVTLVDMYRDLLFIGDRLKTGIHDAVDRDAREAAEKKKKLGEDEESEEEEEEESERESDDEEDDSEDEDKKKNKKSSKIPKALSDIEQLLQALSLHKQQKQHLLIKRAILMKFEEALFGNNNITMTIDLRQMGEGEKDEKLDQILQCKDLSKYMKKQKTENGNTTEFAEKATLRETVSVATSPTDILKPLRQKTPRKVAVNLIKQQYNIRWNTSSGESIPFDFFDLPKHFRKGLVRKAYVETLLYEHKAQVADIPQRFNKKTPEEITKEDFCPIHVYGKKDPYAHEEDKEPIIRQRDDPKFMWEKWNLSTNERNEEGTELPSTLKWINPKVRTLIRKLCQPLPNDFDPEKSENVMYLLVLNETTSPTLPETGNISQIYIGCADKGVKNRWLLDDDAHCTKMVEIFKEVLGMESFKPTGIGLLVEHRLLLAFARQEPFALFALSTHEDQRALGKANHDLVIQALCLDSNEIWGPAVNMNYGLNVKEEMKKRRKFLPDTFPGHKRKHKR